MYGCRQLEMPLGDTIFEIGGQDSKFIHIRDGVVADFTMNEACAAGTGSFLEERPKKLRGDDQERIGTSGIVVAQPNPAGRRFRGFDLNQVKFVSRELSAVPVRTAVA